MYKTFIQIYPGAMRVQLDVKWSPEFVDAANAYVRFCCSPVPGLPESRWRDPLFAEHYDKTLRTENTRRRTDLLIQKILHRTGCRPAGDLSLARMNFSPSQHLRYTFEITAHPADEPTTASPAIQNETLNWHHDDIACELPLNLMYHCMEPTDDENHATAWTTAAQTLLLQAMARAIACQKNLTIKGETLTARLQTMAAAGGLSASALCDAYASAGMLPGIAEHLLIEAVMEHTP